MMKYILATLVGSAMDRTEDSPRDPLLETAEAGAMGVVKGWVVVALLTVIGLAVLFLVGSAMGYR